MNKLLNFYNDHEKQIILVFGLVVGLLVGLLVGWVLWPTVFRNASPSLLREGDFRDQYLVSVAEEYYATGDLESARHMLGLDVTGRARWRDDPVTVLRELADRRSGPDGDVLRALALGLETYQPPAEPSRPRSAASTVLLILLLAAAAAAAGYLLLRRLLGERREPSERAAASRYMQPTTDWDVDEAAPLAQFVTSYTLGDDYYDPSFPIETAGGAFMGECGVGISEEVGVGDPKKVTALEVWVFDKNDIRTVTKVLMSEYAYRDDALRASLASKGDLVPVQEGAEVELETATLVLRARVLELEYGEGQLPPHSFFRRITLELGAWVKPGVVDQEVEPDFGDF